MKTRLVVMLLGLSILMIVFSGIRINQAYSTKPTIYYDGQKKQFTYFNVKNKDIFPDLKELMPGDRKEQEVIFKADNIKADTKVFLNISKNYDKNIREYIKIYADNKELVKDEEYIEIGNFLRNSEFKLKVVVDIPKEAGNELEDLEYNMDWNILVQEENGKLINVPNTYDDTNIILYIIICALSFIAMIYSIKKLKDRKEN